MIQNRPLLYLLVSLVLHTAFLFLYLPKFKERKDVSQSTEDKVLKVYLNTKRQIVRSSESRDKRIRDDSYLSDKNRSFERQSVARKVSPFVENSGGDNKPRSRKELTLSDIGFKKNDNQFKSSPKNAQTGPESSTNDHIEDVPLGDHTYLNSVEFKYYGFYFRIRQRLEQFWGRSIQETAEKLIAQKRTVEKSSDHVTALRIVLDQEGQITAIKVLGSSGVRELDDAAIRAFNEAGPFPNPPKGMIVKGKVTLQWGFIVKT